MNQVVHPLTEEQLFCLEGCRNYPQYHRMRHGFECGTCAFCHVDRSFNKILWEDEYAMCWEVPQELGRTRLLHHFIVVPKAHVRFPWLRSVKECVSMFEAMRFLSSAFDLKGGIVATRFGDMSLNAGTVPHLHENIMVPNGTGEVRIPVFKDQSDRVENEMRAADFARRYEAGEVP